MLAISSVQLQNLCFTQSYNKKLWWLHWVADT